MMWEIARASEVTSAEYVRQIGRLRDSFHGVYRPGRVEPACFAPVLFMPGSDTHGNVDENLTRYGDWTQFQVTSTS